MTATTHLGHVLRLAAPAGRRQIASYARRTSVACCGAAACLTLVVGCGSVAAPAARGSGGHTPGGPAGFAGTSPGADSRGSPPTQGYPCIPASGSGYCATPGATAGPPAVSLDVTIYPANWPVNRTTPTYYILTCDPAGGTVPDPAAACTQLLADTDLFAPRPPGVICPMIMANGHAVLYGTYLGRQVNEAIADGGCDLQRFDELQQIFPAPGAGSRPPTPRLPGSA